MKCPICGNKTRFETSSATATFFIHTEEGVEDYENCEWFDETPFTCRECNFDVPAGVFQAGWPLEYSALVSINPPISYAKPILRSTIKQLRQIMSDGVLDSVYTSFML